MTTRRTRLGVLAAAAATATAPSASSMTITYAFGPTVYRQARAVPKRESR